MDSNELNWLLLIIGLLMYIVLLFICLLAKTCTANTLGASVKSSFQTTSGSPLSSLALEKQSQKTAASPCEHPVMWRFNSKLGPTPISTPKGELVESFKHKPLEEKPPHGKSWHGSTAAIGYNQWDNTSTVSAYLLHLKTLRRKTTALVGATDDIA